MNTNYLLNFKFNNDKARMLSPAIIFIDEIDGIGIRRKFNLGDEH